MESPAITATATGMTSDSRMDRAMKLRKMPLPVSSVTKARPPLLPLPPACGCEASRSPTPIRMGKRATTPSRIRLRRRANTCRSSEPKNRSQARVAPGATPAAGRPAPAPGFTVAVPAGSAIDVVPLSGQADEQFLQRGGDDRQTPHANARVHQVGRYFLDREIAQLGTDLSPGHLRIRQSELAEHRGR